MKKRKLLAIFAALAISTSAMAALTACELPFDLPFEIPFFTSKKTAESLTVATKPTKTTYEVGERFDPTGMVVKVNYSNGTDEEITDYAYSPTGALSTSDTTITITWGDLSTTVRITISDPVVSVEKLSDPDKLEGYYLGQKFDPTGMVLKLTYKSGKTENKDVSEISGVEYSQPDGLTTADKTITISYAGESWTYELNLIEAVYIEAEDGNTNAGSPSNPTDASLASVQTSLLTLKEATLRRENPDLSDEEIKALVDEYAASQEYETDTEHYRASGDTYLGNVSKGCYVDFVFDSDSEGTGSIAFRLSSQYLLVDNGNWTPILMGDCQFNVICDFYVNGVQYDIPDSVILPGGGSEGGVENQLLWVNWQEVLFENINFVEGRNVIRLQFKNHNLVATAQTGYNFTANIDSLIITADDCTINPYSGTTNVDYATTSVKLEQNEDTVNLVVEGTYSGTDGYVGDLFSFSFGDGSAASVVSTVNGVFTVTVDVTDVALGTYTSSVNGKTLTKEDVTATSVEYTVGNNSYALAIDEDGNVTVVIDSDYKVVLTNAALGKDIKLEIRGEGEEQRVYYVIAGGACDYTVAGYSEEEGRELAISAIAESVYFDLQGNPYMQTGSWNGDWETYVVNEHVVTLSEDGKSFEVAIDITDLAVFCYTTHADTTFVPSSSHDFKPEVESFTDEVTLNGKKYEMIYVKDGGDANFFACVGIRVTALNAPEFSNTVAKLVEENGKVYFVIESAYKNYTEEEAKAEAERLFNDIQRINQWTSVGSLDTEKTTVGEGTVSIYVDITSFDGSTDPYFCHYNGSSNNLKLAISDQAEEISVTVGGKKYDLSILTNQSDSWKNDLTAITVTDLRVLTVESVKLENIEDKAVIVISGTSSVANAELALETVLNGDPWTTTKRTIEVTWDGNNFTAKFDVTDLGAGKAFWIHFDYQGGTKDLPTTFATGDADTKITIGDLTYELTPAETKENSPQIVITQSPATEGEEA